MKTFDLILAITTNYKRRKNPRINTGGVNPGMPDILSGMRSLTTGTSPTFPWNTEH